MSPSFTYTLFFACVLLLVSCGGGSGSSNTASRNMGGSDTTSTASQSSAGAGTIRMVDNHLDSIEWMSSANLHIVEKRSEDVNLRYITDSEFDDYKPTYSPDGSQIAFFRVVDYGDWQVENWKTKICVINADATGYKELTTADTANWNPVWTRDGSNRIIFTKFISWSPYTANVYSVDPNGEIGDEQRVSRSNLNEFAYSSLQDGRIFIRRYSNGFSYHLLTPGPEQPSYEMLHYFPNAYLHKMSISPSETKIAYMKVIGNGDIYENAVIAYADFDANVLRMTNERIIVPLDNRSASWYPAWTENDDYIIYAHVQNFYNPSSSGEIRAYHLETETTAIISQNNSLDYRYPNVKGVVK